MNSFAIKTTIVLLLFINGSTLRGMSTHWAFFGNDLFDLEVDDIIAKKENLDYHKEYGYLLHNAFALNNSTIFNKLLLAGSDPNIQNSDSNTPLICACDLFKDKIVDLLLKRGVKIYVKNKKGKTVFDITKNASLLSKLCDYEKSRIERLTKLLSHQYDQGKAPFPQEIARLIATMRYADA